jgi:hypothetical protein
VGQCAAFASGCVLEASSVGSSDFLGLSDPSVPLTMSRIKGMKLQGIAAGFSIGIIVTTAVFLGTPPPVGLGYSAFTIAGFYGTPTVRCPSNLSVRTTEIMC